MTILLDVAEESRRMQKICVRELQGPKFGATLWKAFDSTWRHVH